MELPYGCSTWNNLAAIVESNPAVTAASRFGLHIRADTVRQVWTRVETPVHEQHHLER